MSSGAEASSLLLAPRKRSIINSETKLDMCDSFSTCAVVQQMMAASSRQKKIIRDDSDMINGMDVYVLNHQQCLINGDIYGVVLINQKSTLLYIVDGMGKGLSASMTSILSAAFINRAVDVAISRKDFKLSRLLGDYIAFITNYIMHDECVSMSLLHINMQERVAEYVNCGMYSMLVKTGETQLSYKATHPPFISSKSRPAICKVGLPSEPFHLLMYTDGACESDAMCAKKLSTIFMDCNQPQDFIDRMAVETFDDDTTMIYVDAF